MFQCITVFQETYLYYINFCFPFPKTHPFLSKSADITLNPLPLLKKQLIFDTLDFSSSLIENDIIRLVTSPTSIDIGLPYN